MATTFRLTLNREGVRQVALASPGVRGLVSEVAQQVAANAEGRGIQVQGEPGDIPVPITVTSGIGGTRAHAWVRIDHPSGLAVEAKHRILGGGLP